MTRVPAARASCASLIMASATSPGWENYLCRIRCRACHGIRAIDIDLRRINLDSRTHEIDQRKRAPERRIKRTAPICRRSTGVGLPTVFLVVFTNFLDMLAAK